MKPAVRTVCNAFLHRLPPEMQQAMYSLLPPEERQALTFLPKPGEVNGEKLSHDLLSHMHFSWLAPFLRTLGESDVRLFLAALTKEQAEGLIKFLGIENHLPTLVPSVKKAIRSTLLEKVIHEEEVLPPAFIPDAPLNMLLDLPPSQLKKLIHYLGLHDLSFEMRQIIATAKLKQIFATLSEQQGKYLNSLLLHREPLVFQRLFLEKWDGSKESMNKLLEERGLHRLSHALFNYDQLMVWHLTHHIEMHLGHVFFKYREKPTHERAEAILTGQIEKICKLIHPTS